VGCAGRGIGSASRGGAAVLGFPAWLSGPPRGCSLVRPSAAVTSWARKVSSPPTVLSWEAAPETSQRSPSLLDRARQAGYPVALQPVLQAVTTLQSSPGRRREAPRVVGRVCSAAPAALSSRSFLNFLWAGNLLTFSDRSPAH
jgi:hypothetical protein